MTGESGFRVKERRKSTRRPLERVVSLSRRQERGATLWYMGWLQDASAAGMKITVNQAWTVQIGESVTVICLPDRAQKARGKVPVQMQAEVVWQSEDRQCFGLRFC